MITEEDVNKAFEEEFDGQEPFLLVQEILELREKKLCRKPKWSGRVDKEMTAKEIVNLLPIEKREELLKMIDDTYQDMQCGGGPSIEIENQYRVGMQIVKETLKI